MRRRLTEVEVDGQPLLLVWPGREGTWPHRDIPLFKGKFARHFSEVDRASGKEAQ